MNQLRWVGLQIIVTLMLIAAYLKKKTPGGSNFKNKKLKVEKNITVTV